MMARLGDICDVRDGTHDSPPYVAEGYPLVTSKNIVDGNLDMSDISYISLEDYNKINERSKVSTGDIIMPMIGTIGNPYIIEAFTDFAIKNVALIKFPNDIVYNKYIFHFLNSEKFKKYIVENNRGGTQKFLSLKDIRNIQLNLPSLAEQMDVVKKLDKVCDLISIRNKQLEKLDELVKSRFIEMFGDNVPIAKLGDVCRMINGDRGKNYPSGDDFVEDGVPFVNAGHLQKRKVDFCNMNYITEEKFNLLSQGKMQEGDILYCLRGSLGKHGLVDFDRGVVASSLVILRCNQEQVLPQFLLYALETPEIELQLKAANNGSSQPNLSAASVKAYDIKLPTIEQQKQFVSFVEQTDKSKFEIQKSLEKLETLKKALMQKYFG